MTQASPLCCILIAAPEPEGTRQRNAGDENESPSVSCGPNTNHVAFELITQAAREDGIPYQVSVKPGGTATDASTMQINRGGMATGLLGVPLRYMHTPCELLSLKDVEDGARLMAAYSRRVKPDTDFTPR